MIAIGLIWPHLNQVVLQLKKQIEQKDANSQLLDEFGDDEVMNIKEATKVDSPIFQNCSKDFSKIWLTRKPKGIGLCQMCKHEIKKQVSAYDEESSKESVSDANSTPPKKLANTERS